MRLILFITIFATHLFAIISAPVHTSVRSVDLEKETLTVLTPEGAQRGMYGILIHWFDQTHSIALSWVEVTKVEEERTTLAMFPIRALEQSALPSGTWVPEAGDEVILGYNYHRALLISPNPSAYKKVTDYHPERKWIHPDIFATVLSSHGHPSPLKEDFSHTCRANNIGIVSFVFDKSVLTVDCHSFKILQNRSTALKTDEIQLPFYTRVSHIEANWFGAGSSELEEYAPYYIELLAEYNPENSWIQTYKKSREKAIASKKTSPLAAAKPVSEESRRAVQEEEKLESKEGEVQ